MDLNELAAKHIALLEQIAANTARIAGHTAVLGSVSAVNVTSGSVAAAAVTPADVPREEADEIARRTAAAAQDKLRREKEAAEAERAAANAAQKQAAEAEARKQAALAAEKAAADKKAADELAAAMAEPKVKYPSADECRAALKVYAETQGNPAAIALLNSFGANAVSALDETKRADFIAACK